MKRLKNGNIRSIIQNALVSKSTENKLCTKKRQKTIHRLPEQSDWLCLKENVVLLEFVLWIDDIFKSGFVFNR